MKYFFVSDVHLGIDLPFSKKEEREKAFVAWLDMVERELVSESCEEPKKGALFLLGDIFDYWYEYKRVVPMGFIRTLGKLAQMADKGIEIHFFKGNHDTWTYDYLEKEIGMKIHDDTEVFELNGKRVLMGHGHGLGIKNDLGYKILHTIFNSRLAYNIFSWVLHPDIAVWFGNKWSSLSRTSKNIEYSFKGDKEPIFNFIRETEEAGNSIDVFIFGHLHSPHIEKYSNYTVMILGEWLRNPIYGYMDHDDLRIEAFRFNTKN